MAPNVHAPMNDNDVVADPAHEQVMQPQPAKQTAAAAAATPTRKRKLAYETVNTMHAHPGRKRDILAAHPDIKELFGYEWKTKWITGAMAFTNLAIAGAIGIYWEHVPLWAAFLVMYFIGTPINHACAMVIHECAHDLTAATVNGNRAVALMANLPLAVPAAMSFCRYHPEHHSHMGVIGRDLDLAPVVEIEGVGDSQWKKFVWKCGYMFSYGLRPLGWNIEQLATKWEIINIVSQIVVDALVALAFGIPAVVYMFMCTLFAFGMHPCAAHFIQEHYVLRSGPHNAAGDPQETFSYYGRLNPIILNVGFHNEHHDLSKVPWTKLPEVRRRAPEFYENLVYHTSVWEIMRVFQAQQDLGPASRITRTIDQYKAAVKRFVHSKRPEKAPKQD
ncbi:fatty acid desaturase-domain-containing protein [Tribonema minus]|uniref:Fatty acid desaturase-domain-containing protein n=1 Tax=Tribonema minus TaxID=303371 RepID=A0A836C9I2_9STRA|nr:fatty acid desaturase-domain-containing protein [Tribonema minus]